MGIWRSERPSMDKYIKLDQHVGCSNQGVRSFERNDEKCFRLLSVCSHLSKSSCRLTDTSEYTVVPEVMLFTSCKLSNKTRLNIFWRFTIGRKFIGRVCSLTQGLVMESARTHKSNILQKQHIYRIMQTQIIYNLFFTKSLMHSLSHSKYVAMFSQKLCSSQSD